MRYLRWVLFSIILLFAFFLRAQEVLFNNYLFLLDMGRDMIAVKGIVFDHHLTLIGPYTSLAGVFQGPFYYYLLAIPTALFGGDPLGALILMLLISLATALVAFYYLRKHFGFTTAIIGFFLFAVCPEAIAAATYTWNPHPMWLLITLYIFLMYELHLGKTKVQLFLWPLIGIMFHFEAALGFFVCIITLIYSSVIFRKKLLNKNFLLGLFLLFITFVPQILFELRHNFLMTNSVIAMFAGDNKSLTIKGEQLGLVPILQNHIGVIRNNYFTSFPTLPSLSIFPPLVFLGSIVAFYFVRASKKLKNYTTFYKFYFLFLILFLIVTSLYQFPLRYWFLTGFQSFYIIASALTLSLIWKYKAGKVLLLVLAGFTMFYVVQRLNVLYINPPDDGGVAKIRGKVDAIDYVYNDSQGTDFGLLVFTPPVLTDAYDYLIWWRGKVKNRSIPPKEKKGTFYLLIEPDGANESSYKGWMETVIKTGTVVSTVTLPRGFIIQKRLETKIY